MQNNTIPDFSAHASGLANRRNREVCPHPPGTDASVAVYEGQGAVHQPHQDAKLVMRQPEQDVKSRLARLRRARGDNRGVVHGLTEFGYANKSGGRPIGDVETIGDLMVRLRIVDSEHLESTDDDSPPPNMNRSAAKLLTPMRGWQLMDTKQADSELGIHSTKQVRVVSKHPRDAARRERGQRKCRKKKRKLAKFDDTLGYPGEGPPRRKPDPARGKCASCRQPGHLAAACPTRVCTACGLVGHWSRECVVADRKSRKKDRSALARAVEGKSTAAASQIADEEMGRGPPLDVALHNLPPDDVKDPQDVRPPLQDTALEKKDAPAELTDQPAERKAPKTKEEILADITGDMFSRAATMLLTKDPACQADRSVVLRALASIARKDKLHVVVEDPARIVTNVYLEAQAVAVSHVERIADSCCASDRAVGFLGALGNWWRGRKTIADVNREGACLTRLGALKHKLAVEPYSVTSANPNFERVRPVLDLAAAAYAAIAGPVLEESLKRVAEVATTEILMRASLSVLGHFPSWAASSVSMMLKLFAFHGPAIVLAAFESRGMWKDKGRVGLAVLTFVMRVCAHALLAKMKFRFGVIGHVLWNVTMARLDPEWMLAAVRPKGCLSEQPTVSSDVCCGDYPIKKLPTQEKYVRVPTDPVCQPGFGVRTLWGVAGYAPTVYRPCSCNEKFSMDGRVGKKLPAHSSPEVMGAIVGKWLEATAAVLPIFEEFVEPVNKPMPFKAWASTFPPARRDALLKVKEAGEPMPPLRASSFIKRETAVKDIADPTFKDPRFIQGCPIELSAAAGPTLRPFAKKLREGLRPKLYSPGEVSTGRQIVYTCGLSSETIGRAFARAIGCIENMCDLGESVVFLEDDQSRFDLHLLAGPFGFLARLYRAKLPKRVAKLLRRKTSAGRSNLGTKYSVPYTMQSGWPDTSVGDTAVNAAMKYYIHGRGRKWISIICGDDSVTITTDRELEARGGLAGIISAYAGFGMEVEAIIGNDPLQVGFCSGRFFPVGDSYVLMPRTGKILAKICSDHVDRSFVNQLAWLRGITCALATYGQIDPLLGSLAIGLQRCTGEGRVIRERENEFKAQIKQKHTPCAVDYETYYDAHYALSSADVAELCSHLREVKLGTLSHHPLLVQMVGCDCE